MTIQKKLGRVLGGAAIAAILPMAAAAHDDGKGNIIMPGFEILLEEFSNVVAANANAESNAPKGHAPCIRGMAAKTYPCNGVDMLSHLTLDDLGSVFVNDMWGWTDPLTGRDYALVGQGEGMTIVDVTDAKRPEILGILPARFTRSRIIWRDIKTYQDHAYIVSEDDGSHLQIMDLTQVRNHVGDPMVFEETAVDMTFNHAHNININEDTGYAYVIGADICTGGLAMFDISTPDAPVYAGCGSNTYVHDTQCVVYSGPDAEHTGKEICVNSAATFNGFSPEGIINTIEVIDVTDKSNPIALGVVPDYSNDGYSHQGWLSPDQTYFYHNDELDEFFDGSPTSTRVIDLSDLDNPYIVAEVDHATTSIGHNQYTEGDHLFSANYTSGLRVYDTSLSAEGELPELAWFDTYPANDNNTFEGGAWTAFPYFKQKKLVAVTTSERGLFLLQPRLGN